MEWQFQVALVTYMRLKYPRLLIIHPANEGKRSKAAGVIAKKMGLVPGTPDLLVMESRRGFYGLALELKAPRGRVSPAQAQQLTIYAAKGWSCHVLRGLDTAMEIVDWYLN